MNKYPELRTATSPASHSRYRTVVLGAADLLVWLPSDHKIIITLLMDQARLFFGYFLFYVLLVVS